MPAALQGAKFTRYSEDKIGNLRELGSRQIMEHKKICDSKIMITFLRTISICLILFYEFML